MHQELKLACPTLSKNEAYRLSQILNVEGVWKKNIHRLIQPDKSNLETIANNYKIKTAISLILSHWEKKDRILVVSDDLADSIATNAIITKVLRIYGADIDYKVVRADFVKRTLLIDSTNGDYKNTDYDLIIGIGSITHLELTVRNVQKRNFDIIIDDSPIPAFEIKNKDALEKISARVKEIKTKLYAFPKCKVFINPYDPESNIKNKELSKASIAYKIVRGIVERKGWDMEDLEGCLTLQGIGIVAGEKKMFHSKTQSYENRYLFEAAKQEMTRSNSIWLMALNEIKRTRKWERSKIESLLSRMIVPTNEVENESDIIQYFTEPRVGEARMMGYNHLASYEARKVKLNEQATKLREAYKTDTRFNDTVFAKTEYTNGFQYTTLVDANNKNATKLNKVAVIHLTTNKKQSLIIISTPNEIKNEMFIGYLLLKYGKVQRRGRAVIVAVNNGEVLHLLKALERFVGTNKEEILQECHNVELEEITDSFLSVVEMAEIDLTLYASRNELIIKQQQQINGPKIAQVKRVNNVTLLSLWDDVKIERELEENEKVDVYYKLKTSGKYKQHRIIRVEQFENDSSKKL